MAGYTAKEVAELVELPRETIWELTRAGILEPDRTSAFYQYSFQDLLILRTAKELIQDGVRKSRLNRALTNLKQRLPTSRPLSSIRISKDGGHIVVREENTVVNAESGQLHLNFDLGANPAVVSQLAKRDDSDGGDEALTADDWFDLGVDLEAVSPDDAPSAYRRAIELEPEHAEAHVNLGRILQERDELELAENHYRKALEVESDNVLAAFNLGTLLDDLHREDEAIEAYLIASEFADAHYNLARLYELRSEHALAVRHLKQYRKLMEDLGPAQ